MVCVGPGRRLLQIVPKLTTLVPGNLLVLLGYAGAVSQDLRCGDLVICDKFLASQSPPLGVSAEMRKKIKRLRKQLKAQGLSVYRGASYTTAAVVSNQNDKLILRQQGATLVEMENYWAMQMARQLKIDMLAVRIILDTFTDHLPDLSDTLTADGHIAPIGILRHLITRPWHLPTLIKLAFSSRQALTIIEQCCRTIAHCPGLR